MHPNSLVLLPPLLVLVTAIITRKLKSSLILGLICGSLIATNFAPMNACMLIFTRLYNQLSDIENIYSYTFLFCVSILITILNHIGAAHALAERLLNHIKNKKQAEYTVFVLSLLLALDDYLNSLTVGYVLRPVIDKFKISRVKFAYLVHTFAGPIVMIVPISTWAAFITSQIEQSGISMYNATASNRIVADPFYVYIASIPCIYYAIFTIITAFIIIHTSWCFGPMNNFESQLPSQCDIDDHVINTVQNSSLFNLTIPLGTLFTSVFLGMLYTGNYWLFGGNNSFICAFKTNQDALFVLCISSILSVFSAIIVGQCNQKITLQSLPLLFYNGIELMKSAVLLVILASTLGTVLRLDLETGKYLASLLLPSIKISYLPVMFFIVASVISIMIGTAWGTIALLLPIGIPMAHAFVQSTVLSNTELYIIIPAVGAILAGATFGDHTSPISSAIVMSATSSGCSPIDHIKTQFLYTIAPFIGSIVAFCITGLLIDHSQLINYSISLIIGLCTTICILYICNKLEGIKTWNIHQSDC